MKTLILGSRGYLGNYFQNLYPDALCPSLDIADAAAVADVLETEKPDVIINCAGKTGRPNVDWCEDHMEETLRANVTGPLVLLEECSKRGVYFVHIGSGCIYEGDNDGAGFTEEHTPNFDRSFYSRTKAWTDQILKEFDVLQLRLRMPFDGSDNPRSLLVKLKAYSKFHDTPNSLTYMPDFMDAAAKLIEKRAVGIYNVVNPGLTSPMEIMSLYKEIVDPSKEVEYFDPAEAAKRRSNCHLSVKKLEEEGIVFPEIGERVKEALEMMKESAAVPA